MIWNIEELQAAYARVFSGPDGERVLADLLFRGRYEKPLFSPDALEMAHAEGRRSLVLQVLEMVRQGRRGHGAARSSGPEGGPTGGAARALAEVTATARLLERVQGVQMSDPGAQGQGQGISRHPKQGHAQ